MKLLARDTDYAIRAISFTAESAKKVISVNDMVAELGIPRPFLRKTLQVLSNKGILKSCKGRGGGFSLAMKPEKIFLVELMRIFQGPIKLNECFFKKKPCPNRHMCRLKKRIDFIEDMVRRELDLITIGDLVRKG